jgi:hypothetical protein
VRPRSRRRFEPIGEILVSYEASELPTSTLKRLFDEATVDHREGDVDVRDYARLLHWLLRIAIQKLTALERP